MINVWLYEKDPLKKELMKSGKLEDFRLELIESTESLNKYIANNLAGFEKTFEEERTKYEKLEKDGIDKYLKETKDLIDKGEDPNIAGQLVHFPGYYQEHLESLPEKKKENIDFALKAIFLMSGSFLETKMNQICEISAYHKGCNFPNKNYTLNGYKEFLEKKIGISFNQLSNWNLIYDCYREIRNTIIHQNSEETIKIKKLPSDILNILEINKGRFLFHNKLICENFIKNIKIFFEELVKELIQFFKHPYLTNRIKCIFLSCAQVDKLEFINHIKTLNEDEFYFEIKRKNEANFSKIILNRKGGFSPREIDVIISNDKKLKDFIKLKKDIFMDIFEEDFGEENKIEIRYSH